MSESKEALSRESSAATVVLYELVASDEPGRVRYVGITADPVKRLAWHRCASTDVGAWARSVAARGASVVLIAKREVARSAALEVEYREIERHQIFGDCDLQTTRWLARYHRGEVPRVKRWQHHDATIRRLYRDAQTECGR